MAEAAGNRPIRETFKPMYFTWEQADVLSLVVLTRANEALNIKWIDDGSMQNAFAEENINDLDAATKVKNLIPRRADSSTNELVNTLASWITRRHSSNGLISEENRIKKTDIVASTIDQVVREFVAQPSSIHMHLAQDSV